MIIDGQRIHRGTVKKAIMELYREAVKIESISDNLEGSDIDGVDIELTSGVVLYFSYDEVKGKIEQFQKAKKNANKAKFKVVS